MIFMLLTIMNSSNGNGKMLKKREVDFKVNIVNLRSEVVRIKVD